MKKIILPVYFKKISSELVEKKFIVMEDELDLVAEEYRNLNAGLFRGATLHIFVFTLNCSLKCLYCQAEFEGKQFTSMTFEVAEKAVDFALNSSSKSVAKFFAELLNT